MSTAYQLSANFFKVVPSDLAMEEPDNGATGMQSVEEEPDSVKNFEIDDEMETMLEDLEDLMFEFVEPGGAEDEEEHDDEEEDENADENDGEGEKEKEVGENEEEEEEREVGENVDESENDEVQEDDDQGEADTIEEEQREGDEIVEEEKESEELSEGETPVNIHTEGESETEEVENIEKKGSVENQMNFRNKAHKDYQKLHNSKDMTFEIETSKRLDKSISEDSDVKRAEVVKKNSSKETENSGQPSSTCTNDKKSSTVDKVKCSNQVNNKKQSLPTEKTDQNSHESTTHSTGTIKLERKSSLENELPKVMDKCDKQATVGCVEESNVSEEKVSRPVAQNFFQTDFGMQTTFELSMLTKKEVDDDLENISDENFESGECTSSDDEEAVNALMEDKMFNHKIDNMMNNTDDTGKRKDSSSKPSTENDKMCNSKKKNQIIKLLYKKIKSVGENKIIEEMLSKKLINDESKEKLLEIIRYCVEKRKEKIRMKKLKKKAHLLKVTKNNDYLESLKEKTEVVLTQAKGSKTRSHSPIVVGSKITKRVIVDCNTVDLKSERVDNDLRHLIERKQNLVKQEDSSLSLPREKKCHKKVSRCKKKGCATKNCKNKKHISKEERKLRKSEKKLRKSELQKRKMLSLLKKREMLRKQYILEELRKKRETSSTSRPEVDVEKQKKIELEKIIKEKIAMVFNKRDMKQAEVVGCETFVRNEAKQESKGSAMRSREGSLSSNCSRKSTAHPSYSSKPVVKGPAADSFSELYETLGKKSSSVKEVTTDNEVENKTESGMKDDDDGELFPTISSMMCEDMDLDSDVPSPPPPPIISTVEEEEEDDELQVEHVSRKDKHDEQGGIATSSAPGRFAPIVADQLQTARSSQVAVKPRVPLGGRRRSRSPVSNNEANDWGKLKSRSRSRSPKPWKARSPVTNKPEAIVAPRRRSPSPNDRYNKRNRVRPAEPAARPRDPPSALWKRRSRSRSRSRENRSAKYSPTRSSSSPSLSPPRSSRQQKLVEEYEEAVRHFWEPRKKPDHKAFHVNGFPDPPLPGNEHMTYSPFNCMANQFVHNETFLQPQHPAQSHMPPAHMMSPYPMNVADPSMGQYPASAGMLAGHPPAMGYQGHDVTMQALPQAPPNSSGQQVATNSMAEIGVIAGQSSGGTITTMNENDPLLSQGLGKSTHCHHHSLIADGQAQAPFNNPPEGFPYFNTQTISGIPPNMQRQHPEMDNAGNSSSILGFPRFPPPGHPPFKVVHHPQFPYPIPVPYIEPPCPAPPPIGPMIPFLRPPPNLNQHATTDALLNTQPPLPLTEPPSFVNPPLPPSPAPSTACSSPVRPSSPAISECGSVRSTSSRKKIRHDLIDLIKGKLEQGEQIESPCSTPRRNKSFSVNDLKDIISTVRKNLAQEKPQSETPDRSSEDKSSSEKQDKPTSQPEERKLRIEFKKPVVKNVISREIAPEFLKAMQEDEEEEEGEIVESDSRKSENSFVEKSDDLPTAELKDDEIELDEDSCRRGKTKPKPDREAQMQKQMKMLEILNGLSSKISKDHKTSPSSATKVDRNKNKTPEKIDEKKMSQKETGAQLTVERSDASKLIPSSSGKKLQDESKTVPRKISSVSESDPSFGEAEFFYKDDKQKKTEFPKRSPDYKSTSSSVASKLERNSIDSVPDFFIGSGMVISPQKVPDFFIGSGVDISPLKVQESPETQSATKNKNSADQSRREERKCVGQIVFCKSYKGSSPKSEHEKQTSTLYKRSRFSDIPNESVDLESHHRSENKSGSECELSNKTVVENVEQIPVPTPPHVTESAAESKNNLLEKSAGQEKLSTPDVIEPDQNKPIKDQQVDCTKNEVNKISREQVLKLVKRELAHVKAVCRASSGDKLKNTKSDNQETAQEKSLVKDKEESNRENSSVAKDNQGSTQEKLSLAKDSEPDTECVEPVDVSVSSDLKNEGPPPKSENARLASSSSSKNSTTDVAAKTDLPMNKEPQVMSEPSTSNNNSTVNPKAKISLSDPRLNRGNNVQVGKDNEAPLNLVSDPRLNRDPRAHSVQANKHVEMSQSTSLDPRLNRTFHSDGNRNAEISRPPTLDPRLHRTHNAEVGKNVEMSQTSMVDSRLSRPHHDEAVRNVELLQTPSSGPTLNRDHDFEVKRNFETSQKIQQTETMMPNKPFSEVPLKKTQKPNLKSLTLRVMNECDPVILREFGNAEDNLDDEESEADEIEENTYSSPKEEATGNKSTTASKSQASEKSCSSNLNRSSEADTQNPKLKLTIGSQNAGNPKLKLSPTERSEQSRISQKIEQGHPKLQSQPLREQLEKSQNHAQFNKKINPQNKMHGVKENNEKPLTHDSPKSVAQVNKEIISQDQDKDTDKRLVKDDSSRSTVQEHKKMHSQDSVASKQVKENVNKPVNDRRSSLETSSNKEKIHTSSTRKEPSPPVNSDAKLDSTTDKKNTPSSTSGNSQSTKPKSTTSVSKSESKNVHSNSKRTEDCSKKVVTISKDKPVSKIQNQAASKSLMTSKVDNSKLQKDKKIDKSEIQDHSKLAKNRRSSYESVPSTSSAHAQKNNCPSSDVGGGKQRRASLDLAAKKDKKVELKGGEIGTSKQDIPAKSSTSATLEKPSNKSSNTEIIDLKRTETVNNVGKVNVDEHDAGKKLKVAKYPDKTPAHQTPTQHSSSKFVVSNLSNNEFTNMEPPERIRSSVIEISSSDDECVKIISPVSKKSNVSSRDTNKKIKHRRSDSVLPSSNVESAKSRDHPVQKNKSSSAINVISKVTTLLSGVEKKIISEVDELKRLLESDSSDEETDYKPKKSKPVAKKDRGEKVLKDIPTKKAVVSESTKEVTTKKDESENVIIRNINERDKSMKKVADKKFGEINESPTTKKAETSGKFDDKTEKDDKTDKSLVNVTNENAVGNNKSQGKEAKEVDEINRSKTNINTIEPIETSQGNVPLGKVNREEKSNENLTNKKMLSSTAKEIITTEKVKIQKTATKSTETVKNLRTSIETELVENVEEIRSSTTETCHGDTKMKELTLSNEDFNFDYHSPKDINIGPNSRKIKKLDKKGKLKNKFLKIGDDLFQDQESNESSDSFKNLITNICGTLEENSDNPAVTEIGIKNCEDASLVVAESLKMLSAFAKVAQSVFRERKRICVDNIEVTDDVLIQHIADMKKTKGQKNKLVNKVLRSSNRMEKDVFDNNSIVSSDSYNVFEFSEDLPAITNDRRSLRSSSSEKNRPSKPHLNVLETENDKTAKKDSTTQFSSIDACTLDTSSLESSLQINTAQSSSLESTSADCNTNISTQSIEGTGEKSIIEEDDHKTSGDKMNKIVAQKSSNETLLQNLDQVESLLEDQKAIRKKGVNKFSVQTAKESKNSTDVIDSTENCNEISNRNVDEIETSSDKIVSTKCFDVTVSQNDDKIEEISGEELVGKKGFNKFSTQEVVIIESPAGVVIGTSRDDEIPAKSINETVSSSDKIISTSSGQFQIISKSTFQQSNKQQNSVIRSKVSKKLQARYKANSNAFKVSTTDESTKKRKSSLVASPDDDDDAKKLCTSNDSEDNGELSISCPALETKVNLDGLLIDNDVMEKSSIDNNSSTKTKNKNAKRARLLEDVSCETVPNKKRKLKSRPGKQEAETCNVIEEDTRETEDSNSRVMRARNSVGKVVDSKGVENETSGVVDDDSQETEGISTRVTRARKSVGKSVRSDAADDTSNLLADNSQETEEFNTRVKQAGKLIGTSMRSEEMETSNVLDDCSQETELNTRVTRKMKSIETSARSDEIETSNVLVEDDSQETEELNTRVTRARKSVGSVRFEEGDSSNVPEDSSQETELNFRVTRKMKSIGTCARIDEVYDDPMENSVDGDKNLCDGESRDIRNKKDKELEEGGGSKKKLRSSVKISNKEETSSKSSTSEDELLWIKIRQLFNKSSRTVGTNVTQLRGKAIGFENFESTEKQHKELDLDNTIASLIRLKQQRDAQKL